MIRLSGTCAALAAAQLILSSSAAVVQAQSAPQSVAAATSGVVTPTAQLSLIDIRPSGDSSALQVSPPSSGPVVATVALRARPVSRDNVPEVPRATRTNSTAMMVVGLAAVVVGVAVGDDAGTVLILAGTGVGLYGLYKFMQE